MSGSDFWAKRIGGIAQPRPATAQQGAWWQDSPPPQQPDGYSQAAGRYNPALQAQMPGQYPGQVSEQDIRELRSRLDAGLGGLSQEEMELIAEWELDNVPRHTARCPACGSGNFAPAGTKNAHGKLGSDKCFDCGQSSSTYTSSPEPAARGGGASKAPWLDVRQTDTGGAAGSMYLQFRGTPASYVPRG